jgi:hypothetical protein
MTNPVKDDPVHAALELDAARWRWLVAHDASVIVRKPKPDRHTLVPRRTHYAIDCEDVNVMRLSMNAAIDAAIKLEKDGPA